MWGVWYQMTLIKMSSFTRAETGTLKWGAHRVTFVNYVMVSSTLPIMGSIENHLGANEPSLSPISVPLALMCDDVHLVNPRMFTRQSIKSVGALAHHWPPDLHPWFSAFVHIRGVPLLQYGILVPTFGLNRRYCLVCPVCGQRAVLSIESW